MSATSEQAQGNPAAGESLARAFGCASACTTRAAVTHDALVDLLFSGGALRFRICFEQDWGDMPAPQRRTW